MARERCGKPYKVKIGGQVMYKHCRARKGHVLPCRWVN